jgi:hypothetical protein
MEPLSLTAACAPNPPKPGDTLRVSPLGILGGTALGCQIFLRKITESPFVSPLLVELVVVDVKVGCTVGVCPAGRVGFIGI